MGDSDFELRGFDTARVPMFSDFQKQRIAELLEEYEARVVAISPGLFKCPFPPKSRERFPLRTFDQSLYQGWRDAQAMVDYHFEELLPKSIEYAHQIGAQKIVIFSFQRGTGSAIQIPDGVLETLYRSSEVSAQSGLELVVEVEDGYWADTGKHTANFNPVSQSPCPGSELGPGQCLRSRRYTFSRWLRSGSPVCKARPL